MHGGGSERVRPAAATHARKPVLDRRGQDGAEGRRYGAVLLAALLTGDPVPALPSSFTVTEVAFQAGHNSRVDDFLIVGRVARHAATVSIAVRRDPMLIASNDAAVKLIAAFPGGHARERGRGAGGPLAARARGREP